MIITVYSICLRLDLIRQRNTSPSINDLLDRFFTLEILWNWTCKCMYTAYGTVILYPFWPLPWNLKPFFCRTCSAWRNENGLSWSLKSAANQPPQDCYSEFSSFRLDDKESSGITFITVKHQKCPAPEGSRMAAPPKFNIAPEKWWLEDYFPIGKVTFQGLC